MNQHNNASSARDTAIKDVHEKIKQNQPQQHHPQQPQPQQPQDPNYLHEIRDPYRILELIRSRL